MPDDPFDVSVLEELAQLIKRARRAGGKNSGAVSNQRVPDVHFGITLDFRTDEFIRPVWQGFACECFAMPAIFRTSADGNPPGTIARHWIGLLRGLESDWRWLAVLEFEPLEEFSAAHHTTRPIELPRWRSFTSGNPFRARNDMVADESISVVVALKKADDFLHAAFLSVLGSSRTLCISDQGHWFLSSRLYHSERIAE